MPLPRLHRKVVLVGLVRKVLHEIPSLRQSRAREGWTSVGTDGAGDGTVRLCAFGSASRDPRWGGEKRTGETVDVADVNVEPLELLDERCGRRGARDGRCDLVLELARERVGGDGELAARPSSR